MDRCIIQIIVLINVFPLQIKTAVVYILECTAIIKGTIANTAHTIRDRNAFKACAVIKSVLTDLRNAIRDSDTLQPVAAHECMIAYKGNSTRYLILGSFSAFRIKNYFALILAEYYAVIRAVHSIVVTDSNIFEILAFVEHASIYTSAAKTLQSARDSYAFQRIAPDECHIADGFYAFGQNHFFEALAAKKCLAFDCCYCVGDRNTLCICAPQERIDANAGHALLNYNGSNGFTLIIPRGITALFVAIHVAGAGDSEGAIFVQCPFDIIAAVRGRENTVIIAMDSHGTVGEREIEYSYIVPLCHRTVIVDILQR